MDLSPQGDIQETGNSTVRTIVGIVAGLIAAFALILIGEFAIGAYVGETASFDNVRRDFVSPVPRKLPAIFSVIFTLLNILGAGLGGYVATRLARRRQLSALPAAVVGIALIGWMLGVSFTSSHLATAWLAGICATLYLPFAIIGYRLNMFTSSGGQRQGQMIST
jgi:hypothetical protein